MCAQFITSGYLLLALSGLYFKFMTADNTISLLNISKGAIVLALNQAFTISSMLINFVVLGQKKNIHLSILFCLFIGIPSITGIIFIMINGYSDFIGIWLCSFIVYFMIDVFFLQIIYACFLTSRQKSGKKNKISKPDLLKFFEDDKAKHMARDSSQDILAIDESQIENKNNDGESNELPTIIDKNVLRKNRGDRRINRK